jgi:phage anti-repressor protein
VGSLTKQVERLLINLLNHLYNQLEKYQFTENVDWQFHKMGELVNTGFQTRIDYDLTIDMAKELAMVESNEAGKKICRYFIWAKNKTPVGV